MSEKKAIITILGIGFETKPDDRAEYSYGEKLKNSFTLDKKSKYTNMLPLIIENFADYTILPLFTQEAKDSQIKNILEKENIKFDGFDDKYLIEDDKDFNAILKTIDSMLELDYDEIVVDLTHGFRHLPILAIINLIIYDIKNDSKIKHIFFAKEQEPRKKYEIIELKEYLDLAKLSFVLSSFNDNYTVGNKMTYANNEYQNITDNLRIISTHILSNSLKQLTGKDSILIKIIEDIEKLSHSDKNIITFKQYTDEIIEHLKTIQELSSETYYIQLYKLSSMMNKRGYLLNSITLLNEAIGFYCVEKIRNIDDSVANHIQEYEKDENNLYQLADHSKNIVKQKDKFSGVYLFDKNQEKLTAGQKTSLAKKKKKLKESIDEKVLNKIEEAGFSVSLSKIGTPNNKSIRDKIIEHLEREDNEELIGLIIKIESLRNNLAHGNSSTKIKNVKLEITFLIKEFGKLELSF